MLKNCRIVQERRKRVRAERIGFGYHDVRFVNDDSIPDGVHWADSMYLVRCYFQHSFPLYVYSVRFHVVLCYE